MKPQHTRKQKLKARRKRKREARERIIQAAIGLRALRSLPVPSDPREGN